MVTVESTAGAGEPTSAPTGTRPLVIAHRGASDALPEHTVAAYELAIEQCADYLELDLVMSRDGVLVARHENELSRTTDVAERSEFADRQVTKTIDDRHVTGWFTEDFRVAELQSLVSGDPAAAGGPHRIATFDEVVDLATRSRTCDGGPVGLYVETKHPSYFAAIGLPLEPAMLAALEDHGLAGEGAPVFIQSFETSNLRSLDAFTPLPLVQLVDCVGEPYDLRVSGDARSYADLISREGLREISTYADAVGACKDLVVPRDATGDLAAATPLVDDAHATGMSVHVWTFERQNRTLPSEFQEPGGPDGDGNMAGEVAAFVAAGVDGIISDSPDQAVLGVGG